MGGSLGLAARARGLAGCVVGFDPAPGATDRALDIGALDLAAGTLEAALQDADCVVVAAPAGRIPALLAQIAPVVRQDALLTDLGSVKAEIVAAGSRLFGARFVAGHPMAGSERSGVESSRPDLFVGAAWAVVRAAPFTWEGDPQAARLADLIRALGARPIPLTAAQHDHQAALVSHLPHALAFAYARTVESDPDAAGARALAAGSYRDLTRVASADPVLWNDIFRANRNALSAALQAFQTQLAEIAASLEETP